MMKVENLEIKCIIWTPFHSVKSSQQLFLRLTTNPGLPILSRLESTFVEITSLTKTTQCGHPVLVINEWKDTDTFPLKNKVRHDQDWSLFGYWYSKQPINL